MHIDAKVLGIGAAVAVVIGAGTYFGLQHMLTPRANFTVTINGKAVSEEDGLKAELNFEQVAYSMICNDEPDTQECLDMAKRIEELQARIKR